MIVTCDHCGSRYKLGDDKVSGRGAKITCPSCRHVFVVHSEVEDELEIEFDLEMPEEDVAIEEDGAAEDQEVDLEPATESGPADPPGEGSDGGPEDAAADSAEDEAASLEVAVPPRTDLDVYALKFADVGIDSWKVKVKIGLVYDFQDYKTLRKYIQDGRVTPGDMLSHDSMNWTPIGDIPDLEQHFINVYVSAQARTEASSDFDEDLATDPTGSAELPKTPAVPMPQMDGGGGAAMADLEAVFQEAAAEVDGEAEKAPVGPRFVDPFEQAKQRRRRTKGPRKTKGPKPSEKTTKHSSRLILEVVLLFVVGALGFQHLLKPDEEPTKARAEPKVAAAEVEEESEANPEEIRNSILAKLESELDEADEEEFAPQVEFQDPNQLRVVVPREVLEAATAAPSDRTRPEWETADLPPTQTAQTHRDAGDLAARKGDWSTAVRSYREAVAMAPRDASNLERLGMALYRSGDSMGAQEQLVRAVQGGAVGAYKWLGHIARDMGDISGAVGHYNAYLQQSPSDADAIGREIKNLTGS